MNHSAVAILRVFLVLLVLGALVAQVVFVPVIAASMADSYAEFADRTVPYTILVIAIIGCGEVAIVAMWALLSRVRRSAIFTNRAFRWVDLIIGTALAATVLTFLLGVGALQTGPFALVLALAGATLACATFAVLMVVMRGLLRSATTLENELAEVV